MLLLSPSDVMRKGLDYCGFPYTEGQQSRLSAETNAINFHSHYGSSALVVADLWYDITTTDEIPGAPQLEEKDKKSEKGFRMYMAAHHFLWTYPRNSRLIASMFGICERYSRGEPLWKWVQTIAAMKAKKIVWDGSLNATNTEIFVVSIDGVDFRIWEKKHPTLPVDTKWCSKKFKHCAVKYELCVSIFHPKCVWINGPFRGAEHDITMFREGLKARMPRNKMAIADKGYITSRRADEQGIFATPNPSNPQELKNFKSRAQCRHETFNGRIKFFKCLSETFRHGIEKHKIALEAVCVIVQYQMDNGSEIFAV